MEIREALSAALSRVPDTCTTSRGMGSASCSPRPRKRRRGSRHFGLELESRPRRAPSIGRGASGCPEGAYATSATCARIPGWTSRGWWCIPCVRAGGAAWSAETGPLRGYSLEAGRTEREWEAKFRAIPDPAALRAYMQRLSARPHHVGSPYDKDNAEWIAAKIKEWGLDAQIETFDVLFPTPKERLLEMTEPARYTAKIAEPAVGADSTSSQRDEQLPVYNAYSIDGDVTAPLVYVNYGIPADYEELDRLGISVKGAIVIARYGGSWRGIKPKVAGEHGAIGCLIYSDPRDGGYAAASTFPTARTVRATERSAAA